MVSVPTDVPPTMIVVGATAKLIAGGRSAAMVIVSGDEPVPPALVALMVALVVPPAVGVPVITPVAVLTVKPTKRPVALKLVGRLFAVMV